MTKLIEIMKIGDDAHLILEESDVRRIVLGGIFWPEIKNFNQYQENFCDIAKHA